MASSGKMQLDGSLKRHSTGTRACVHAGQDLHGPRIPGSNSRGLQEVLRVDMEINCALGILVCVGGGCLWCLSGCMSVCLFVRLSVCLPASLCAWPAAAPGCGSEGRLSRLASSPSQFDLTRSQTRTRTRTQRSNSALPPYRPEPCLENSPGPPSPPKNLPKQNLPQNANEPPIPLHPQLTDLPVAMRPVRSQTRLMVVTWRKRNT